MYDDISKHRSAPSLKFMMALGTSYHDLSLSLGNPDLLFTFGANIDTMVFPLISQFFLLVEPITESGRGIQITLIFRISGRMVSGKHAEIDKNNDNQNDCRQDAAPQKDICDQKYQIQDQQKTGELVLAVSPLHETVKFLSH